MKIAYCGPVSLRLLEDLVGEELPKGYEYPLGAYLCREYLKLGHEILVVTSCTDVPVKKIWKGDGITICVTPRRRHYLFCLDAYRKERKAMETCLREQCPDVIHAQWTYEFAEAARASGTPTLVTARDSIQAILSTTRTPYRLYRYFYGKNVLRKIEHISAISPYMADELRRWIPKEKEIRVIPNGVPDEGFVDAPPSKGNAFRMVSVTGTGTRKNAITALRAFRLVKDQVPDAEFTLIGGGLGEGSKFWERAKKEALLEGVCFLGRRSHQETITFLREQADIFLHTTVEESFGMSIVEAMACGLPVVAGEKSGAVPWLLAEDSGVLVDVMNPDSVAEGVIHLLRNSEERNRIACKGFERARKHFRLSVVAESYTDALRDIS